MEEEFSKHIIPVIPPDLFKKYIAHARKNIMPVLSPEAAEYIHNFFLKLRGMVNDEKSKSIPITHRQEEALIRLTEASARVGLRQTATVEDAQRAKTLMLNCLRTIGYNEETGELDSSIMNSGYSSDQRSMVKNIKEILRKETSKHVKGEVPLNVLLEEAEKKGISKERLETSLMRMSKNGDIFRPTKELVKLTA
jgi:replicative DNA helicase Mcm